jgi:hypothetical protein
MRAVCAVFRLPPKSSGFLSDTQSGCDSRRDLPTHLPGIRVIPVSEWWDNADEVSGIDGGRCPDRWSVGDTWEEQGLHDLPYCFLAFRNCRRVLLGESA